MTTKFFEAPRREVHGRMLPGSHEFYKQPVDAEEWKRLDSQHRMFLRALGGLSPCEDLLRAALAPQDGVKRQAIDIGSGSGIWAIDLAKAYPDAEVLGIDIAPNPNVEPPPNCRFMIADIRDSMPGYEGKFDVWNGRFLNTGLNPGGFEIYLKTTAAGLKPSGLFIAAKSIMIRTDENNVPLRLDLKPDDPNYSHISHLFGEVIRLRGNMAYASLANAFRQSLERNPDFENVQDRIVWIPAGWAGPDGSQAEAGEWAKENTKLYVRSHKPLLLSNGYTEEDVDKWMMDIDEELDSNKFKTYTRWNFAWATRKCS